MTVPPTLKPFNRRTVLRGIAAGTIAAPLVLRHVNAQGLRKVTFTLSWLPEGFFAWAFVAKAKGFWKEQGLDVTISRGNGSIPAAQAIAAKQFDFGVSNSSAVVLLASQNLELKSLGMVDYESSMGVGILDETPIHVPKDFEGKKVAQTLASSDAAFFKPFAAANGVNIDAVQLLNMDARVRNQALVEKKVDAITGFASSIIASIAASGTKVRLMMYSDYGVSVYGDLVLLTTPDRVEKEPELCQQMADGLFGGLKFSLTNAAESEEIFLEQVPETKLASHGREFAHLGMAVQRFNILASQDPQKNGLGWVDMDKLAGAAGFIMKYQAAPEAKTPDLAALFTNQFAGKVTLTPAEWETASKDTAFIAGSLHNKA
jgi:ABC-type nitrate/sulfonate/bicarbonate transport system substrate-binding protein